MTTEIITAAAATEADLKIRARLINEKIAIITGHEAAFEEATLEHRLEIGRELAEAKAAFGIADPGKRNAIGSNQHSKEAMSTVDMASPNPLGFCAWLAREVPDFNRSKADYYINAFNALGLPPAEATAKTIRNKVRNLTYAADEKGHRRPSLKSLYKAGKPATPKGPLCIEVPDTPQLRLEDAREAFHLWQERWEKLLSQGVLDDLDRKGLEALKEFIAGARDRINARLKK